MKATAAACSPGYRHELEEHCKSFSRMTIIFPTFRGFQNNNSSSIKIKYFKTRLAATKGRVKNMFNCFIQKDVNMTSFFQTHISDNLIFWKGLFCVLQACT